MPALEGDFQLLPLCPLLPRTATVGGLCGGGGVKQLPMLCVPATAVCLATGPPSNRADQYGPRALSQRHWLLYYADCMYFATVIEADPRMMGGERLAF